jgi:hypothetical protein
VEIQIGGYKDEVLCDIMPMDVCHVFWENHGSMTGNPFMMAGGTPILLKRMVRDMYYYL